MGADTKLVVVVRMYDGGVMPKATVTLVPKDGGAPTSLAYDPDSRIYLAQNHPPGKYELHVAAPNLLKEERPLFLAAGSNHEAFYLGPPGLPFLYRGWVRIPFAGQPDLVGVALTKHLTGTEEQELEAFARKFGLTPVPVQAPVRDDRGRVFRETPGAATPLPSFGEHPLVRHTGPVIRLENDSLSFITNELVVKFEPHISNQASDSILDQFGLSKIRAIPYAENTFLVHREGPADLGLLELAHRLHPSRGTPVIYAEHNLVTTAIDTQVPPQDFLFGQQWTMPHVGFDQAWARLEAIDGTKAFGDPEILIAIMDRGIKSVGEHLYSDPWHPDFAGNVSSGQKKIARFYNFADMRPGNTGGNIFEHGVKVAGVASALANNPVPASTEFEGIAGAAPNCRVISLTRGEARDDSEYADAYIWIAGFDPGWKADGIDYELTDKLPPVITPGADVINNSFIRPWFESPSILKDALDYVTSYGRGGKGCVTVFSAGNNGVDLDGVPLAPLTTYPRTIGVAASATGGTALTHDTRTNYSNYGSHLDVCAPSGEILNSPTNAIVTTAPVGFGSTEGHTGGPDSYDDAWSGTSAAAPQVSGLVALMLSMNPDLTWIQVRKILRDTAVRTLPNGLPLPGGNWNGNPPIYSPFYGYGRIDADEAVRQSRDLLWEEGYPVADTWIKENPADDGDVPSLPMYSHDVWVRNLPPDLDPGPVDVHQSPIRGQDNYVYARVRNRGALDADEAYVRILITRWAGTQYVYPDDFIPFVAPGENPPSPEEMAPGSYLLGESLLPGTAAGGEDTVVAPWQRDLIPPEFVVINGTQYSWADSCLLVDVTPHDGPPPTGNRTADNNNLCQRNLTIVDVSSQNDLSLLFFVGHKTNRLRHLELLINRKPLSPTVKLALDYVNPATTRLVHRALSRTGISTPLVPTYRGGRMIFGLPTRTRVAAPILRDPGEYQPLALIASGLQTLDVGQYWIDVIQRIPGGPAQGMLRFRLVRR